jgi:hypothetical protein
VTECCRSLLSRIDRESSGSVSAEQFLDIFAAKWMEADREELQVLRPPALLRCLLLWLRDAQQLFSFSLYDEDNKGYITREDLERLFTTRAVAARQLDAVWCRVSAMLCKEESAVRHWHSA